MNKFILIGSMMLLACFSPHCKAQDLAVKANVLYNMTTTFSFGVEKALAPKWTASLDANYNPWTFSNNRKWKHWLIQPEAKYWFCEKFNGSSVGLHLLGGQANVGNVDLPFSFLGTDFSTLRTSRFEGWFVGAGLSYNYAWMLSDRWTLEAGLGMGYIYFDYDQFECKTCGAWQSEGVKHYFGLTKAALNVIYFLR